MQKIIFKLAGGLAALVSVLLLPAFACAADGSVGFTVSPPILELTANPGESQTQAIAVYNSGEEDLSIQAEVSNITSQGEAGQVVIVSGTDESLPSLQDWVSLDKTNFDLGKGDTVNVTVSLSVPEDASPGSYFASILFGTAGTGGDGSNVSVANKIGSLIALTVSGDVDESAQLLSFTSDKSIYWSNNQTVDFSFRTQNDGNVYINPTGYIVLTDIFGRQIGQIDVDGKNVLPSAVREATAEYASQHTMFGPYTATLALTYGDASSKNMSASLVLWMLPWWSLVALALLIIILFSYKRIWRAFKVLFSKEQV